MINSVYCRYRSQQEIPSKSRSFESAFEKKPPILGHPYHPTRSFSVQHLPHHQQQQQQQHPHPHEHFEDRSSSESSLLKLHASSPHLPTTHFPHRHLEVVVEQSPPRDVEGKEDEEDLHLPPGASANNFFKDVPHHAAEKSHRIQSSEFKTTRTTVTGSEHGDKAFAGNPSTMPFPYNASIDRPAGIPDDILTNTPFLGNSNNHGLKKRSVPQANAEEQYPRFLDHRFPSEDDLQQYLHQVEVQNYLQHHRELAQLQHDIDDTDSVLGGGPAIATARSSQELHPQPHSTGSLLSHQSSESSQKSAGSQGQRHSSSTGSLRKKTAGTSSGGPLKQYSSGSLHSVARKSGTGGGSHTRQLQRSAGSSVHHQSRSSQESGDRSNPSALTTSGISTSKRAVLQSSGRRAREGYER